MPSARVPLAAAALVAAATTLGAGGAAAGDPDPTPTPVARAAVTLNASSPVLRLRGARPPALTLSGTLASTRSVRNVRVRLVGHSAAYRRDTLARTVRTDRSGRFSLRVRPRVNARYRAHILPFQGLRGSSPARVVEVFPHIALSGKPVKRRLRLTVAASAPATVTFAGGPARTLRRGGARKAFFYLRLRGERRYRLVGTGALSGVRCATACTRTAALVVRSREVLRRTKQAGVCFRGVVFRGLGDEAPCGAARRRF